MSNIIGQNPARDIEAKERIEKKFRNKKIAVSLIYAVVGAVGLISNPGAVIKLKSQAKKDLESWKKKHGILMLRLVILTKHFLSVTSFKEISI